MTLWCTNIVLQNCRTSSASSSTSKHHFSTSIYARTKNDIIIAHFVKTCLDKISNGKNTAKLQYMSTFSDLTSCNTFSNTNLVTFTQIQYHSWTKQNCYVVLLAVSLAMLDISDFFSNLFDNICKRLIVMTWIVA